MTSDHRPAADPGPELGVVIPTLDEASFLPGLLDDLELLSWPHRTVLADGGSTDTTAELARARGIPVLDAPRGRARQMNAGAAALDTPWLLFLHADSRMSPEARKALADWLGSGPAADSAAHFAFKLDAGGLLWRLLEVGQRVRQRTLGLVYGDQGLVISREAFEAAGAYPDVPVLEDVALVRTVRSRGRLVGLPAALHTSARRYRREGPLRAWLRNAVLIGRYLAGTPPEQLAASYSPSASDRGDRLLLVFAKAPIPGRVKTRMAEELGPEEAARIYRRLGRLIADNVREGSYRTVVCYDPPGEQELVAGWLGPRSLEFWPQVEGGLGDRLVSAFATAFRSASRVCVIGTDAPDVDADLVHAAFDALETSDVVMGPATDGGYYLLGLSAARPELFADVPWSTSAVAEHTERLVAAAGLRLEKLPVLADVDFARDIPESLR